MKLQVLVASPTFNSFTASFVTVSPVMGQLGTFGYYLSSFSRNGAAFHQRSLDRRSEALEPLEAMSLGLSSDGQYHHCPCSKDSLCSLPDFGQTA